jgi:micrococcal nuclease
MEIKNKTLFLLIMGFVFLFLASWLPSGTKQKITAEGVAGVNNVMAESTKENLIIASSTEVLPSGFITLPGSVAEPPLKGGELSERYYKVAKIVDGDTIDLNINGQTERVRLIGINTPEVVDPRKPVECFGREASANAKKLLDGAEVRITADPTQDDRDKYGRLLRYVWRRGGLFYNLEAIKDGFAYEYTYQVPYQYQKDFKAAQKYAEDNKLGLWADGVCGQKNVVAIPESSANENCLIKGNINSSGDKIYHLPACSYYKQTVIDESKGEKRFCAEAEAIAAGWRKALNCP